MISMLTNMVQTTKIQKFMVGVANTFFWFSGNTTTNQLENILENRRTLTRSQLEVCRVGHAS